MDTRNTHLDEGLLTVADKGDVRTSDYFIRYILLKLNNKKKHRPLDPKNNILFIIY